jgi:peptidyl-prolyl cis-trans isomerase A (cyclophilin A)
MLKRALVVCVALYSLAIIVPNSFAANKSYVVLITSAWHIELALDSPKTPVSTKEFVDYVNGGY